MNETSTFVDTGTNPDYDAQSRLIEENRAYCEEHNIAMVTATQKPETDDIPF